MPNTAPARSPDEMLVNFYNDILQGREAPSVDYQKRYLLQLINTKISKIETTAKYTKSLNYLLNITVMSLSAAATILLGLHLGSDEELSVLIKNIALIISATMTFVSGLIVFWDIKNYWIRNKIMLNKLKELRYEYVFHLTGNAAIQTKDLKPFLSKFLSCLGDEYWEKFLKDIKRNDTAPQD